MSLSTFAALAFFFRTIGSPTPAPRRAPATPARAAGGSELGKASGFFLAHTT